MYKAGDKRGQITNFIIIAILIVAAVALVFVISPKLRSTIGIGAMETPDIYLSNCIKDSLNENVKTIASQGGSIDPKFYYLYQDQKLQYLCYTGEYYSLCVVQIPFVRNAVEKEIQTSIQGEFNNCLDSMEKYYSGKNYNVNLKKGTTKVEMLPQKIILTSVNSSLVLTKGQETLRYQNFKMILDNNIYELAAIAQNIVEWESTYGEAEAQIYMDLYHNIKVEKHQESDETKVYIITDKNTGDIFQFASKSLPFPPGY